MGFTMNTLGKFIVVGLIVGLAIGLGLVSRSVWEPVLFPTATPTPTLTPTPGPTATPEPQTLREQTLSASNGKLVLEEYGRIVGIETLVAPDEIGVEVPYALIQYAEAVSDAELADTVLIVTSNIPLEEGDNWFYVYFYTADDDVIFYGLRTIVENVNTPIEFWDPATRFSAILSIPLADLQEVTVNGTQVQ